MAFFSSQHRRIHYTYHYGHAEEETTLIFVHGLGLNKGIWNWMLPRLDPRFNWLAFDLPGHGESSRPASPTLDSYCAAMHALLQHLQIRRIHFVGLRYGAYLAFQYALRYPDETVSLSLLSFPFFVLNGTYEQEVHTNEQLLQIDRKLYEKKLLYTGLHPLTLKKARWISRSLLPVDDAALIQPLTELIARYHSGHADMVQQLKALKQPVFFMQGEYDPIFPATLAMVLSDYASASQFMVIPDASYFIPLDQPLPATRLLNRFITGSMLPTSPISNRQEISELLRELIAMANPAHEKSARSLSLSLMTDETRVYWNGRPIEGKWNQRSAKEILFFLIKNNGAVKRDTLIDAFNPDVDVDQARNQLRVSLSHLNRQFTEQANPALHDVLIITRDSIALNAEASCDLVDYQEGVEHLLWATGSIDERCDDFLRYLQDYRPKLFKGMRSAWGKGQADELRSKLAQVLAQLLVTLKDTGDNARMKRLLTAGKKIEPYSGFSKEWALVVRNLTFKKRK